MTRGDMLCRTSPTRQQLWSRPLGHDESPHEVVTIGSLAPGDTVLVVQVFPAEPLNVLSMLAFVVTSGGQVGYVNVWFDCWRTL